MTTDELERALDRFGGDLARWPPEEAERARALLAIDPMARRLLESAREVDRFVEDLRSHAAPAHLARRILARAVESPDHIDVILDWLTARLWRPAMLAMLVVTAGFLTGLGVREPVDQALAEDVMTLAFSDLYAELDDAQP